MRTRLLLLLILSAPGAMFLAQESSARWLNVSGTVGNDNPSIQPGKYGTFTSEDIQSIRDFLLSVPAESTVPLHSAKHVITLPLPDGSIQRFLISESPVLLPPLAAEFSEIRSFSLKGLDDRNASGKLDFNVFGLHAMVLSPRGSFFIDPYSTSTITKYISYYIRDFKKDGESPFSEVIPDGFAETPKTIALRSQSWGQAPCVGSTLFNYRLALACTHQYAQAVTGNPAPTMVQTLSKMVVTMNRVNGVYEREVAVRLLLVPTTTAVIFTSASTDPFTANNNILQLTTQSQKVIDSLIGNSSYDIGHTFCTGGGGLAQIAGICVSSKKAQAVTGTSKPSGDPFDIDYVAHEMGHQLGAGHTFNAITGSCNGNRKPATATEPGSGITIMGYAGICGMNNIGSNSIPFFHAKSFDEIVNWTRFGAEAGCHIEETTGNNSPIVMPLPSQYTIPRGTPFFLKGMAFDPDGDALTYSWEDVSPAPVAANWNADIKPYFRSYPPDSLPIRFFPSLAVLRSGDYTGTPGEYLSSKAQRLAFRITARDNRAGGGGVCADSTIVTMAASGPFSVSIPSDLGIVWAQRSQQEITWAVNGTNTSPVLCNSVSILCSFDDGETYVPMVNSTLNDGHEIIQIPAVTESATKCRIKIQSVGNIFFDISNNAFTISADTTVGLTNQQQLFSYRLVPNPVSGELRVIPEHLNTGNPVTYKLIDVTGRLVISGSNAPCSDGSYKIDLSSLNQGMYVLVLTNTAFTVQRRVVKE